MDAWTLFGVFVLLPLAGALISYFGRKYSPLIALIFTAVPGVFLYLWYGEWNVSAYSFTVNIGVQLNLTFDATTWFFMVMMNTVIFTSLLFAISYNMKNPGGFSTLMLLSFAGANGVLLSRDFLSLYIFWELMSWSVYVLVLRTSGEYARIYLLFGVLSAYFILMGIGIVYYFTGSFLYSSAASGVIPQYAWAWILLFFILGFGVKMAIVPLHVWAPYAYSSEQSFVAFLSGGLSKLGTFGIMMSMYAVAGVSVLSSFGTFRGISLMGYPFALLGAITAFIGTILAIFQDDLRKLLAYSSIGQLGYVMVGLGLGTPLALGGALFHAFNHAFFKSLLFLGAGAVIYRTGKYKISEMGGLGYRMPFTFLFVLLAIFSLAGIPITSGFISKWMLYEAAIARKFVIIAPLMLIASVGAFLYSFRILYGVFLGQLDKPNENVKEAPAPMLAAMGILAIPLVLFSIVPGWIMGWINQVLVNMGVGKLDYTTFAYYSSIGGADMAVFWVAFILLFMAAFIVFLRKAKTTVVVDQYDNYLGGEARDYVQLHAAHNFYKPLRDTWAPLLKYSMDRAYVRFSKFFTEGFEEIKRMYTGNPQDYAAYLGIAFLVFLIVGWWLL
ncbi:formate hydrogenlyase subunit 3/multisubunit Na+/H+ antiporter, MnhD subunit [Aciduliprofundum sp. MAR08-339]|uniref:proton-conducting transporter transmembrane domain-containing protein n=1 Tax=Aciduliprofundum sp. (strain MAR08-339) TaxID=673860 RepID=UPI0002A4A05E|nr:formate hydrogenlyase subunit 3/multisubunit Na+/H+ antiporter, MnhD subunit [Aciduliprofundum sp. MAR08-339]